MVAQKSVILGKVARIVGNKAFVVRKDGQVDCYNLDYYQIVEGD